MSATSVSRRRYPLGVALYARQLATGLVLTAISIGFVGIAVATNAPLAILVGAVGALVGVVGASVMTGASLFYQAWPSARAPVREAVVWRPTLALRAGAVVAVVGLSTSCLALVTVVLTTPGLSRKAVGVLSLIVGAIGPSFLGFVGGRYLIARLEADRSGIRCTNS